MQYDPFGSMYSNAVQHARPGTFLPFLSDSYAMGAFPFISISIGRSPGRGNSDSCFCVMEALKHISVHWAERPVKLSSRPSEV